MHLIYTIRLVLIHQSNSPTASKKKMLRIKKQKNYYRLLIRSRTSGGLFTAAIDKKGDSMIQFL